MITVIKCCKSYLPTEDDSERAAEIDRWLRKNVGLRYKGWDWTHDYSGVILGDSEHALAFKLRYGL